MSTLPYSPFNVTDRADSALESSITSASTSLSVTPGQGDRFPSTNFNIYIDNEKINVGARSTATFSSMTRGYDGTTPADHTAAARIVLPFERSNYQRINDNLLGHTHIKTEITDFSHTHPQGDVTNLVENLSGKQSTAQKSVASGYASLNTSGRVPSAELGAGTLDAGTFLNGLGNFISAVAILGEANSGANVGASGVGIFGTKSGVDLLFRKINPLSTRLTITLSGSQIDLDVINSAFSVTGHSHAQTEVTDLVTGLAAKQSLSQKSVASGYASLNVSGRVPAAELGAGGGSSSVYLNGVGDFATPAGGAGLTYGQAYPLSLGYAIN